MVLSEWMSVQQGEINQTYVYAYRVHIYKVHELGIRFILLLLYLFIRDIMDLFVKYYHEWIVVVS